MVDIFVGVTILIVLIILCLREHYLNYRYERVLNKFSRSIRSIVKGEYKFEYTLRKYEDSLEIHVKEILKKDIRMFFSVHYSKQEGLVTIYTLNKIEVIALTDKKFEVLLELEIIRILEENKIKRKFI